MWKYLLLIGLLVISTHQAIAQVYGDCATPNYQLGKCIPLTECTQIYTRLQTAGYTLTDHEINYFKNSQCGSFEGKTLICCTESMRKAGTTTSTTTTTTSTTTTTTTNRPKTSRRISSDLPQPPFCGSFLTDLIIGGERTSLFEYPWLALLYFKNISSSNQVEHLCGGSLINDRYVLTAAHCVTGLNNGTWRLSTVRLGEWDTQTNPDCMEYRNQNKDCADPHLDMTVAEVIVHPNYLSRRGSYHNDIALLRLSHKVTYTKSIQPICLPFTPELQTNDFSNRKVDVVGWGRTETQAPSRYKLKATLEIADFRNCSRSYESFIDLQSSQICASGSGKKDSCKGDSGGPLILEETVNGGNYYFQIGVVSIGAECASTYYPGIYTRVGEFMDWITQNIY